MKEEIFLGGNCKMEARPWHKYYDPGVPAFFNAPRITAQEILGASAAYQPDKVALDMYGSTITFHELRQMSLRMANALVKLGVRKGDRVGLALPNCSQFVVAYLSILTAGAIVVNLNPMYTQGELKFMMENTGVSALFTFDGALPTFRPLAKALDIKNVIVTKVTDFINGMPASSARSLDLEDGWQHFSELLESSTDARIPRINITSDDPALIQFTGGTTGLPKGAVLTHYNIVSSVHMGSFWCPSLMAYSTIQERAVLSLIPYFHIYGTISAMNWGLFNCGTQIILPRFDLEEVVTTIAKYPKITYFPAVPTMITALLSHPKVKEMNLGKRFSFIGSGGAPMPEELIWQLRDLGVFFFEGYGMSESTSVGACNPVTGLNKTGSIGLPYLNMDVRLVDIETGVDDVKPGQPGEILMKGPTIMKGYWNNPEETANQLKDGWLYTGDIAIADEDGFLFIVDRKKDMIIAGGFNIYPREVDEVLYQHPKVKEAVTVGIPDPYRGETIKVYVTLKQDQTCTDKEIIDFCKEKLAPYKVPRLVEFRPEIPKSAVGKILRKILRDEEIAKNKK
jgi:long-chain acyl-CoA synthetase